MSVKKVGILSIGNSFSADAHWYLAQLAQSAGIGHVVTANLYIGGCSLATHAENIARDAKAYLLERNEDGTRETIPGCSVRQALEARKWDFVTLQQASGDSGLPETYDGINEVIGCVKQYCPSATIAWHMTWAYETGSDHPQFVRYGRDQVRMYEAIIEAVKERILPDKRFRKLIPTGTAVQNLRLRMGGRITRDGYHLNYKYGRHLAALTFLASLLGIDPGLPRWCDPAPPEGEPLTETERDEIAQSVACACASPLEPM